LVNVPYSRFTFHYMEQATAIDKAFDVLFHLHAQPEPQRISEIGRALALPKSSVHRLLAALRRRELVEQDEAGRYRPGAGLLGLALGVLEREPLAQCARPVLEQAAADLGETFFLVAARAGRLIVLEKAEGTGLLRAAPRVGSTVPVHASAVGKLYLAHAPDAVVLDDPLPRFTPRTIVSMRRLAREVQAARGAGYAESHGEWQDGLSVTAAPVLRRAGMLGALCVAMPSARKPAIERRAVVARVVQAAALVGEKLGGEGA
jgi:DNA-binding IclR family transcriptional regulator